MASATGSPAFSRAFPHPGQFTCYSFLVDSMFMIGPENSCLSLNQSDANLKAIATGSPAFPAFQAVYFKSLSLRLLVMISFVLNVFSIFCVVYPPLAEMTEEDKNNSWKPGQRKKKSEKVDSTWNPKSESLEGFCTTEFA